jgi:hypothetical protein
MKCILPVICHFKITQHCADNIKFDASLMKVKTKKKKKLKFKYSDTENEERSTTFPVHAKKLHVGNRGITPHSLKIKSGQR